MPAWLGGLEAVKVEHVAETAVGEGRAEDGDGVLSGPVADGALVVDLEAETVDELAGCPVEQAFSVAIIDATGILDLGRDSSAVLLFGKQSIQDRN